MIEWFKDWFDTEEYLIVYRNRNEKEAIKLVDLILNNTDISAGAKVLDMACGTGRHSILFAKKGFEVTAIDLSQNLLSIAKRSALEEKVRIQFIRSDIRHFTLMNDFSLAVNLFTSFGYFETDDENSKIIKNAYEHLTHKGYFVIDFLNRRFIENNLVAETNVEYKDRYISQKRRIEKDRVIKQIAIRKNETEKIYHESVKMYSKVELTNIISTAGFNIKAFFGDYSGNDFNIETSPRIIIIAQK